MDIRDGFVQAVGNTPLARLRKASELTGCTILGKAEFMNPGGSVKDRAALYIVLDAEARRDLRPGSVIVEGKAGNTGIGLALVGNSRGYRTVIVLPQTQSLEKQGALRLYGAELREVPAVPYGNPGNDAHVAERLAAVLARISLSTQGAVPAPPYNAARCPGSPSPHACAPPDSATVTAWWPAT